MWDELRRPATAIAVILLLISVIAGVLTSLYFYTKGEKSGRISLRVDQVQIFDKNRMGLLPLKVVDASGKAIDENVYAANVAIWNSGNAEITINSVREPFQVVLGENMTPLDMVVTNYSSPFEEFKITPEGKFSWKHFDAVHGIKLRILYVNDKQQQIYLWGSGDCPVRYPRFAKTMRK